MAYAGGICGAISGAALRRRPTRREPITTTTKANERGSRIVAIDLMDHFETRVRCHHLSRAAASTYASPASTIDSSIEISANRTACARSSSLSSTSNELDATPGAGRAQREDILRPD